MSENKNNIVIIIIAALVFLDCAIWYGIVSSSASAASVAVAAREYFLDVGQGDSELVVFPGNIKMLIDAGPTDAVVSALGKILPSDDSYIDLAVISEPTLEDFNGYNFLLDHYRVGAFLYNGRQAAPSVAEWAQLKERIKEEGIPLITVGAGDEVRIGTSDASSGTDEIDFLSPDAAFAQSAALNDTGLVELVKTPELRTLFTADIGSNVEDWLVANDAENIRADVLKVADGASKYSSGESFLRAVDPRAAVIEVGKNKLGEPASSTLARLASSTNALILRTDRDGTVEIFPEGGKLKIEKKK